jgi:hypothetical protein
MNTPRFVIYLDRGGSYRWYLQAGNGEKVAASEAYTTKQGATNSAIRVKQIAGSATIE